MRYGEIRKTIKKEKEQEHKVCKNCGKKFIGRGEFFCSLACFNEYRQNKEKYNKEKLLEESKTVKSLCQLGRVYNMTDNGMRKVLKRLSILDEVKKNFVK